MRRRRLGCGQADHQQSTVHLYLVDHRPGRARHGGAELAYLALSGNEEPARVAGLAVIPHLLRLDLSEAVVEDVTAIAAFPALRVLSLNGAQWQELLAWGWDPRTLAAAELNGEYTEADKAAFERATGLVQE
ncbi:hypothetical protein QLQ12_23765 [Actinoplanes sp. NEAU-A12]|uniref:Uncharacterized protein n=1 Tax=Actinoplanes sandaracinus TaxID=3045177 RepID=A0ABT6WPH2_9ACTN|nr:hypothetical protein [Actinoplanes sandaracinus]MDI6101643.1 hypothetical protein [Actinoplanes sandaracinus]